MLLINFSHPLTGDQIGQVESQTGKPVDKIIDVPIQFGTDLPFLPQAEQAIEHAGLTSQDWQTTEILVNLPALSSIAALLLAHIHGRCGYFPPVLRISPVKGSLPPRYEVAEILNLQAVREQSRQRRWQNGPAA